MIKRLLGCAAVALTIASAVAAGPGMPSGKWWRRPEVVQSLSLSQEQQDRLELIFRTNAPNLIDLRADADKTALALRGELDQTQLNRDNVKKLAQKLSEMQGKLFERELMMLIDMRGVLTDDQWGRLRSRIDHEKPRGPVR